MLFCSRSAWEFRTDRSKLHKLFWSLGTDRSQGKVRCLVSPTPLLSSTLLGGFDRLLIPSPSLVQVSSSTRFRALLCLVSLFQSLALLSPFYWEIYILLNALLFKSAPNHYKKKHSSMEEHSNQLLKMHPGARLNDKSPCPLPNALTSGTNGWVRFGKLSEKRFYSQHRKNKRGISRV